MFTDDRSVVRYLVSYILYWTVVTLFPPAVLLCQSESAIGTIVVFKGLDQVTVQFVAAAKPQQATVKADAYHRLGDQVTIRYFPWKPDWASARASGAEFWDAFKDLLLRSLVAPWAVWSFVVLRRLTQPLSSDSAAPQPPPVTPAT